jgi:hypothetical protein
LLAATRGILSFRGEREHEVAVYDLAVRSRLEIEVLDDASALTKVEHVTDGDGYGSEETLVAALELALIKDLYLDLGRFSNGEFE